jgi:hypothetical protein
MLDQAPVPGVPEGRQTVAHPDPVEVGKCAYLDM